MKFEIEVDCPEGWKVVAYRQINPYEWYLNPINKKAQEWDVDHPSTGMVFVIERIKTYREPVLPADFGKACKFSRDGNDWASGELGGWFRGRHTLDGFYWRDTCGCGYSHCRIEVTDAQPN
jgi:hypothetical protein